MEGLVEERKRVVEWLKNELPETEITSVGFFDWVAIRVRENCEDSLLITITPERADICCYKQSKGLVEELAKLFPNQKVNIYLRASTSYGRI